MNSVEIISIVVTTIGVVCFALVFTLLFHSNAQTNIEAINEGKKDKEIIEEAIQQIKDKNKKSKQAFGFVKSVVFYVLLVFLIPVFIFSIVNKLQGNTTMIGENSVMVVASGSMSEKNPANNYLFDSSNSKVHNQFNTYDIIVLNKVNSEFDLSRYDVIAFRNDEGINVIHRIIDIEYKNGVRTFITRGDANAANDVYHPNFSDVIGKYNGKRISTIGIFVIFFQSAPGIITIIATVYCFIMLDNISGKVSKTQEERLKKLVSVIGEIDETSLEEFSVVYKQVIIHKGKEYYIDNTIKIEDKSVDDKTTEKGETIEK